ncbi:MAG: glycosyltransferase family 39 protein [bacterium]|nr:glycosyltransferase family 39 protein [bacterium]
MSHKHLLSRHKTFFFFILLSILFAMLIMLDVNSWYYSAIGDEYAFYLFAKQIALGQISLSFFPHPGMFSIFSQQGVYNVVPVAGSIFQALVMRVMGINHQGWIASSVLIVLLTAWFYYLLVKDYFGEKIALYSGIILLSSHYLWAFSHLGYWNIHVLFTPVASFFFFFRAVKRKSSFLMFFAGLFTALGFYTYFTARLTIVFLFLWCLFNPSFVWKHKVMFLTFFVGLLLLLAPFLFINKEIVVAQMLERSAVGSNEIPEQSKISYGLSNMWHSFVGFYKNESYSHFVSGSLVDPITAMLFTIGLVLWVVSLRKYGFLLTCFFISLLTVGALSPYRSIPITRLFFLLPFLSFMAGLALERIDLFSMKKFSFAPRHFLPVMILVTIFLFNLYRFYMQTPSKMGLSPEALAINVLTTFTPCTSQAIVIYPFTQSLLQPALASYKISQVRFTQTSDELTQSDLQSSSCLVFLRKADTLTSDTKISSALKDFKEKSFYSPAHNREIVVFYKPPISSIQ